MRNTRARKGRREEIMQAALTAYSEKGVFNTRVEEVAAAAGIGKGTVYEYFRSKEELILAAIRYDMEELTGQIVEKVNRESTVFGKIKVMMETVLLRRQQSCFKGFDMNPASIGGSMKELQFLIVEQNAKLQSWLEEIIDYGVKRGEIRKVDSQILLGAIMGTIMSLVRPFRDFTGDDRDPSEASALAAEFFFEGMRKK